MLQHFRALQEKPKYIEVVMFSAILFMGRIINSRPSLAVNVPLPHSKLTLNREAVCRAQAVMSHPVSCADGHVYERAAIAHWLATHSTSPVTNLPLEHKTLAPAFALQNIIRGLA